MKLRKFYCFWIQTWKTWGQCKAAKKIPNYIWGLGTDGHVKNNTADVVLG